MQKWENPSWRSCCLRIGTNINGVTLAMARRQNTNGPCRSGKLFTLDRNEFFSILQ